MKWWDQMPWSSFSECWALQEPYWALREFCSSVCANESFGKESWRKLLKCQQCYYWLCPVSRSDSLLVFEVSGGSDSKESSCQYKRPEFNPCIRKTPWRTEWQPTPVFLHGEFYGQRSLVGYSPWGELDTTEWLTLLLSRERYLFWVWIWPPKYCRVTSITEI